MRAYRDVRVLSVAEAAYLAGLIHGEGTVTLSRKYADEMRQLVVSISNTELRILEFARVSVGAGKLTRKRTSKAHHTPSYAYTVWKRERARLALADYVRLTPRNGKYTETMRAPRYLFENALLGLVSGDSKKEPLQPRG